MNRNVLKKSAVIDRRYSKELRSKLRALQEKLKQAGA